MRKIIVDVDSLAIAMTMFTFVTLLISFVTGIEFVLNFSLLFSFVGTAAWFKYYFGRRKPRVKSRKGLIL